MPTFVLPFPVLNPILVQWGPLAIRWYALAYIAGLVAGWALIRRLVVDDRLWGGAQRPNRDSIDDLLVYCALGVIVGGRLGNVLFYDPSYYLARPLEIFEVWRGGMAFHGREFAQENPRQINEVNTLINQFAAAGKVWVGAPFFFVTDASALAVPAPDKHHRA